MKLGANGGFTIISKSVGSTHGQGGKGGDTPPPEGIGAQVEKSRGLENFSG